VVLKQNISCLFRTAVLALSLALAASCAIAAEVPAAAPDPGDADIGVQKAILDDAAAKAAAREEAAKKILAYGTDQALAVLLDVLRDGGSEDQKIAVARALAAEPAADARFIELLKGMVGPSPQATAAAIAALAGYKSSADILDFLVGYVNNTTHVTDSRIAAVRAIGSLFEKRAAQTLVGLLQRAEETELLRNAACDALVEMTGQSALGRDWGQWRAWWEQNKAKSDAQWRQEIIDAHAQAYPSISRKLARLNQEMQDLLTEAYQSAAPQQREDMALKWLRHADPAIRSIGLQIINDRKRDGAAITPAVVVQIRAMIGDTNADVRRWVAENLYDFNDRDALEGLLGQLKVENDPDVRQWTAKALGRISIKNTKAVSAMVPLLHDHFERVQIAALDALKEMGPDIQKDPGLLHWVSWALREMLTRVDAMPVSAMREHIVGAMWPLRDPYLLQTLQKLASTQNPLNNVNVRCYACKGLGGMAEPSETRAYAAEKLADVLDHDPSPNVRLDAARALENVATLEQAEILYKHLEASGENDPDVRSAAWGVLRILFEPMPVADLYVYDDRFRNQPARRREVLEAIARKQQAAGNLKELAGAQQNLGAILMQLDDAEKAKANLQFKPALDYWDAQADAPQVIIEGLVGQLLDSLLMTRQYKEAVQFAVVRIGRHPADEDQINRKFRQEVEKLKEASPDDALLLIKEAIGAQPPLRSDQALRDLQKQITDRHRT